MGEAAISIAVKNLGCMLIEKAVSLKDVKEDVEWVKNELKRMQCFLNDATKRQSENDGIRNWISEIRNLAHDAEDTIEIFVLNIESRAWFSNLPKRICHLNTVSNEIGSIRKRLAAIEDSRKRYDIRDLRIAESSSKSDLEEFESERRLNYWGNEKHVVGMWRDVEQLLQKAVFDKSEGLSVAAILGMGGIGKSTLARKIYNHPGVVSLFECRVWVVVSSEFTARDVMRQILLKLEISLDDLKLLESVENNLGCGENLEREIHKRLTGKRYFIVLDDVWEATHWESLTRAFPDEKGKASRLLLTSRNQVMTMHSGYVHNMKVLNAYESSELFWRKAFAGKCLGLDEVKDVGEEILRKCGGLPLAISVLGSLLSKKTTSKREWEKVAAEMKHHMIRSREINSISAILELSYQNLSPELKACFLCFGLFKEDVSIEARSLIHIWVALGLVRKEVVRVGEEMEDVAQVYLNELISRYMVQVTVIEYDQVRICHMHDLVRDLAIRKAREEIQFDVLREEDNYSDHPFQSLDKPRHRAIYCSQLKFIYSTKLNKYVRSLFIHMDTIRDIDIFAANASYWKSFELLRVLDLGSALFLEFPSVIGEIQGLRYLRMQNRKCYKSKLPQSWGKLKNLEVLDIQGVGMILLIDKVITKMSSLRHLYFDHFMFGSKVSLGGMRNLRTLSTIQVKDSDLWQIQGMMSSGISKLGFDMSETSNPATLVTYLAKLEKLEFLALRRCRGFETMVGLNALYRVTELTLVSISIKRLLPDNLPPNLSHLTFLCLSLKKDPMPVLERLPKLLYLNLCKTRKLKKMVVSSRGFPSLRVLHLESMYVMRKIMIEENAMMKLEHLVVRRCDNLEIVNVPNHIMRARANAEC